MLRWPIIPTGAGLALLLMLGAALSIVSGAVSLPAQQGFFTLLDQLTGSELSNLATYEKVIILELRLPRLILAIMVGAILSQCGAVMQGLFRNPLADPGIIGVSSGAAVGAIIAIVWLSEDFGAWTIPASAFISGLLTTLLVYRLAQSKEGTSVLILRCP